MNCFSGAQIFNSSLPAVIVPQYYLSEVPVITSVVPLSSTRIFLTLVRSGILSTDSHNSLQVFTLAPLSPSCTGSMPHDMIPRELVQSGVRLSSVFSRVYFLNLFNQLVHNTFLLWMLVSGKLDSNNSLIEICNITATVFSKCRRFSPK